jgi:hypothetical protein
VGGRGAVAVKSTTVVRPVRPWVQQPYYGAVFDGVTLGAVIAALGLTVPESILVRIGTVLFDHLVRAGRKRT